MWRWGGGVVLLALALWNERATRTPLAEAGRETAQGVRFAELSARNAEVIRAMGMLPALAQRWRRHQQLGLGLQGLASDKAANVSAVAKATRMFLQVAILGVGAWLVILEQTTAGVMIAASIVMGRGLAPIESAIGSWRQLLASREAYARLARDIGQLADAPPAMPLPRPRGRLVFDAAAGGPPEARRGHGARGQHDPGARHLPGRHRAQRGRQVVAAAPGAGHLAPDGRHGDPGRRPGGRMAA